MTFAEYLDARRGAVEAALERFVPASTDGTAAISAAMRYSLLAGGKRLRPLLAIAAEEAIRGDEDGWSPETALSLPAACALEMIHTYSLIHDDLPAMDDDALRRGRPTSHVVYGEGMAILAGDGLQAEAFGLLAREPVSDDPGVMARKLRVLRLVAEAAGAAGMVGGQAIDLAADPRRADADARTPEVMDAFVLRDMHARKTGALIRASVVAGAEMAGADHRVLDALDRYAVAIGLAFQIVDDILDVEGATEELGKTAGKDAVAGKPTYPAIFGLDESKRMAEDCHRRAVAALEEAGVERSRLADIAGWIVTRRT